MKDKNRDVVLAVYSSDAERQAVRLVQFALGHAVAFEEPFFDALHRQIQAPRLAVDA
mgnify:CR=1 FL=1